MNDASPRKLDSLESLRGSAAFAVVLSHLVLSFWPELKSGTAFPLAEIWHNGEFAVRLFFVLSGFVLSLSYFKSSNAHVLSAAATRRYFRLYVPAAASVMVAYLLHACGGFEPLQRIGQFSTKSTWLEHFYTEAPSLTTAVREGIAGAILDYEYLRYNEVLWTMRIELYGSFLVFATLALFGRARHRWLIYGILVYALDSLRERYAIDFVCGMALCDWHCRSRRSDTESIAWIAIFVVGCCLGDLHKNWLEGVVPAALTRGSRWWTTLGATCVVISAARSSQLQRLLSARPLVYLGRISFALYLLHLSVLCSLGASAYICCTMFGLSHNFAAMAASVICVAVSLCVAQVGPRLLDPVAIWIGRRVEHQFFPAPRPVVLTAENPEQSQFTNSNDHHGVPAVSLEV